MKFSVIIPTYNDSDLLDKSLYYLEFQKLQCIDSMEVIVVDDGSVDETHEIVKKYIRKISNLFYVYRPRDEVSSRSRARNIGIKKASGDILVFVDSGILLPPNFLFEVSMKYRENCYDPKNVVILSRLCGVTIPVSSSQKDMSFLNNLSPDNIYDKIKTLLYTDEWIDFRDPIFNSVNFNLNLLPAPWIHGWTGGMVVPRKLADNIGGFDENFLGWGGEDIEFSYRMFTNGAHFLADINIVALYYPHNSISSINSDSDLIIHRKYKTLETELLTLFSGFFYNQLLGRLNQMIPSLMQPLYSIKLAEDLNEALLLKNKKSLLVGCDYVPFISSLKLTNVFVFNKQLKKYLKSQSANLEVERFIGCNTFYENGFFDTVILTDLCRTYGINLLLPVLKELVRISKELYLILTDNDSYTPIPKLWDGAGQWLSKTEFLEIIEGENFESQELCSLDQHQILRISKK